VDGQEKAKKINFIARKVVKSKFIIKKEYTQKLLHKRVASQVYRYLTSWRKPANVEKSSLNKRDR